MKTGQHPATCKNISGTSVWIADGPPLRIRIQSRWAGMSPPGERGMSQFYAQDADEKRCVESMNASAPIMVIGRTAEGRIGPFRGTVKSVEKGHTQFPGYPLRITMSEAK